MALSLTKSARLCLSGGNPRCKSTLGSWSPTEAKPRSDADADGATRNRLEKARPIERRGILFGWKLEWKKAIWWSSVSVCVESAEWFCDIGSTVCSRWSIVVCRLVRECDFCLTFFSAFFFWGDGWRQQKMTSLFLSKDTADRFSKKSKSEIRSLQILFLLLLEPTKTWNKLSVYRRRVVL